MTHHLDIFMSGKNVGLNGLSEFFKLVNVKTAIVRYTEVSTVPQ